MFYVCRPVPFPYQEIAHVLIVITTLLHKSTPNSKTVRLLANARIGMVTPMSEEVFIPIVAPVTQQ